MCVCVEFRIIYAVRMVQKDSFLLRRKNNRPVCRQGSLGVQRGRPLLTRLTIPHIPTSALPEVTRHAWFSPSSPILLLRFHQILPSFSFLEFLFSQPPLKCRRYVCPFDLSVVRFLKVRYSRSGMDLVYSTGI